MQKIGKYVKCSYSNEGYDEDKIVDGCGDTPTIDGSGEKCFRIYYQNICGLKLQRSKNTITEVVGFLKKNPRILGGLR